MDFSNTKSNPYIKQQLDKVSPQIRITFIQAILGGWNLSFNLFIVQKMDVAMSKQSGVKSKHACFLIELELMIFPKSTLHFLIFILLSLQCE